MPLLFQGKHQCDAKAKPQINIGTTHYNCADTSLWAITLNPHAHPPHQSMALPRAAPLSLTLLLTLLFTFLLPLSTHGITNDDFDTASAAPALPQRLTLQSWPLSAPAPTPLGQIGYHTRTKTGKYFPLRRDAGDVAVGGLVRIGIQTPGGGWVGTVIDGVTYSLWCCCYGLGEGGAKLIVYWGAARTGSVESLKIQPDCDAACG